MGESGFDVFCPECNMLVEAKVIAEGDGESKITDINPFDISDSPYNIDHFLVCVCRRCGQPFFIRQSWYVVPAEIESPTGEIVLYPTESKLTQEALPKSVKSAYDDASKCFKASMFEPCVLMCRKCLEAICKNLGAEGRDLNKRLVRLSEAGQIDSRLLNWAHEIRLIGNEAAHEVDGKVTKRDARDVLDFTEAIIIYVFSLTKRFESFKVRRAKYSK
ncbi:MAG: DUF4145 domain-containing protein [Deltaproteobacteria bacterium]|nr:DUF4145 domain-containing protein [Deltaproteobacteria bacterium]